jgi:hypothetical protein
VGKIGSPSTLRNIKGHIPLVLASPEIPTCEPPRWQRVVKSRLMDEILSEDPRSVTTVRCGEGSWTIVPRPLSALAKQCTNVILSEDPRSVMTVRFEEETQALMP